MSTTEERGIAALMVAATADLLPPADVAHASRAGGVRRLRRRRTVVVGVGVAVALSGLGLSQLVAPGIDRTQTFAGSDPFGPLVEGPTRGDLAGDGDYLEEVIEAWDESHDESQNEGRGIFDDLRGEPWVAWAGTTPAGPAALVAQKAFLHFHSDLQLDGEGVTTLLGFVGPDQRGRPVVVGDSYPAPGVPPTTAWFVDGSKSVLAGLAENAGLGLSTGWSYLEDGRVESQYAAMADRGGVVVEALGAQVDAGAVRVAVLPGTKYSDVRQVANPKSEPEGGLPDTRLPWFASFEGEQLDVLELDDSGACESVGWDQMRRAWAPVDEAAPIGYVLLSSSLWFGCGRLEDGRQVLVGERALDADRSRLVVMLRRGQEQQLIDAGPIDSGAVLPVLAQLPDRLGWVVADKGATLRHRAGAGPWSAPRPDAALLSASATQVEVTRPGATPVVVDLVSRR